MTRLDSFFALALLFAAGCSSTSSASLDASDAGVLSADTGAPLDDATTLAPDSGMPVPLDARIIEPDSGIAAPEDAGAPPPPEDASRDASRDAGPPDAGLRDSGPPPPPPCAADGFEPNDTDSTARPLGTMSGASAHLTIDASWAPAGDVDTYRLRAAARSTGTPIRFAVETMTPGAMVSLRFECDSMVRRCAAGPGAGLPYGSCEVATTSGRAVLDVECWDPDDAGNLYVATAHASECRYALWLDAQPIPHVSAP